ncbi:hypothetical protein WH47_01951 [Habropoda laboriosa]|uniref:Uncharacterized protein n=1 Tax=Habropoda laboriosa TaxID=597456 RepID=A0A0L7QY31_9HYME|nr:hypothetical protein WH47_01951 [Habropoda laboriosa]
MDGVPRGMDFSKGKNGGESMAGVYRRKLRFLCHFSVRRKSFERVWIRWFFGESCEVVGP